MRKASQLTVMVLSEDKNPGTRQAVRVLAEKSFELLQPGYRRDRVAYPPAPEALQRGVQGNDWKAKKAFDQQGRRTANAVAQTLLDSDAVVWWHIDADVPWSRSGTSENLTKAQTMMLPAIRRALESACSKEQHGCGDEVEQFVAHWRDRRAALDEQYGAKQLLSLGDRCNELLAARFPAEEVEAVGASYAALMRALREDRDTLMRWLQPFGP